jgi:hypothetical protein
MLPTWAEALDQAKSGEPAHVMRLGSQFDAAGIDRNSEDADRAVRYLAKYLTKAIADPLGDREPDPAREQHIDRLHTELQYLCSTSGGIAARARRDIGSVATSAIGGRR